MRSCRTYFRRLIEYVRNGQPIVKITPQIVSLAPSNLLCGRVALITGGTSGIGKAIAEAFLAAGADVLITSRNQERVTIVAQQLKTLYPLRKIEGIELDNANISQLKSKMQNILKYWKIDVLVNNAGLGGGMWGNAEEKEYDAIMDTNLKGTFFLSEIIAGFMQKNRMQGNILNICSSSSLRPANSAYCLSKWGLRGFTEGLAKTLIKDGIVVNGIASGPTATPMLNCDGTNIVRKNSPCGRYIMPEEIANMAVILVSEMGRMIVGDIVYMTGGAGTITLDDIAY